MVSTNFSKPSIRSTNFGIVNIGTDSLLLQNGDYFLLQNGGYLLLGDGEITTSNFAKGSQSSTDFSVKLIDFLLLQSSTLASKNFFLKQDSGYLSLQSDEKKTTNFAKSSVVSTNYSTI